MTKSRLAHGGGLQEKDGPAAMVVRPIVLSSLSLNCQMKVVAGQARARPAGGPPRWPAPQKCDE